MKIWLDDIRPMPDDYDVWVRKVFDCMYLLETGEVEHLSFDHDLGDYGSENSGYNLATWIESKAFDDELPRLTWDIHSQNPVGRDRIEAAMRSAERYWDKNEER